MGATAAILSASSTANQFLSEQNQARAVKSQANFESQLASLQARDAMARGEFSAQQREIQTNRTIGAQRAGEAASGIDANSGTAVDVQADEAKFGAMDAQQIRNNAAREAWGYTAQAGIGQITAANEAQGIRNQSYSTLLTGATNTYGLYRDAHPGGEKLSTSAPAGFAKPRTSGGGTRRF